MPMRAPISRIVALFLILMMAAFPGGIAQAVEPDEVLPDATLESRARHLSAELRCLVCQNQSIDDSNAPLAKDLRLLVRERLTAGDSDDAVLDFVVARYGSFVLLKPPLGPETILLWAAPLVLLAGIAAGILLRLRQRAVRHASAVDALSPEESEKLRKIMKPGD
jgi:cytochrome c-type biogenesis protein CcmH